MVEYSVEDILGDYLSFRNPRFPLPEEITVNITEVDGACVERLVRSTFFPKCMFDV